MLLPLQMMEVNKKKPRIEREGKLYKDIEEKSVDLFRQVTGFYRNDFLFYKKKNNKLVEREKLLKLKKNFEKSISYKGLKL